MKISPCTRDRIPAVVEFLTGRPAREHPAEHASSCSLFEQIYFDNPWYAPDLPSLICEDTSGRLVGFLGVMHRPLVMKGERVRAAMSSHFLVGGDSSKSRNPMVAMQLLRTFFRGPQDISIAERSNESGRRIWEGCGGSMVPLYSFDWFRPVRPVRAVLELAQAHGRRRLARPIQFVSDAADSVAVRIIPRLMPERNGNHTFAEFDAQFAIDVLARASDAYLTPEYDARSLQWLLEMSAHRGADGRLISAVVKDETQRQIGWFVYVRLKEKERVGIVLQLVASDGRLGAVLRALVKHANTEGVALLRGAVDVTDLRAYDEASCLLHTGRRWMLIHTRESALAEPFLHGRALLTGLEGEWWIPPFWGDREAP